MARDQYNRLAALVVSPILLLAGTTRADYLAATTLCFLLPAIAACGLLARDVARSAGDGEPPAWAVWLPAIGCAPLWAATLRGFPDAGGAALAALALRLWLADPAERARARRLVAVGVLLAASYLFRRTYGGWVAGFAAAAVVVEGGRAWAAPPRGRRLVVAFRSLAIVGGAAAVVVAVCAWPLVTAIAGTDFDLRNAGARHGNPYPARLAWISLELGALATFAALAGLLRGVARPGARRAAWTLLLSAAATAALGARVQILGIQHFSLFAPALVTGFALAACGLARRSRAAGGLFAALALLPALYSTVPVPRSRAADLAFGRLRARPEIRSDYDALLGLGRDVRARLPGNAKVYVACGSMLLNSDTLRSVLETLEPGAARHVLPGADFDGRSGRPRLFRADLVLVCEPIQYHMRPEFQRVVTLTAEPFLAGTGVARHYRRLPESWTLANGVRVHAFVPFRKPGPREQEAFFARFPERRWF